MTTIELSGELHGGDLLPMLQLLARLEKSGSLYLAGQGWSARLGVDAGRLIEASFAEARGMGALDALRLVMHEPEFDSRHARDAQQTDHQPERLDGHFTAAGSRSLDAVPRVCLEQISASPAFEHISLKRSTLRTFLAVDGRRTIADLIDGGPQARILMDLARLLDLGLITLQPSATALPSQRTGDTAATDEPALLDIDIEPIRESTQPGTCPFLGFADNPDSHFSRPASLHRCFAAEPMQAVSIDQQRKLCLSGKHSICPRFLARDASTYSVDMTAPNGSHDQQRRDRPHVNHGFSQNRREDDWQALVLPSGSQTGDRPDAATKEVGLYSRLLPAISIVMFVAAVIASLLVFVAPHFYGT